MPDRAFRRCREFTQCGHNLDASPADLVADSGVSCRYLVADRHAFAVRNKAPDVFVYLAQGAGIDNATAELFHLDSELACQAFVGRAYWLRALENRCFSTPFARRVRKRAPNPSHNFLFSGQ